MEQGEHGSHYGKRFTERPSLVPQIKAYSNAVSVQLFINRISQGIILASDLDPLYPTVFVWKNKQIEYGKENVVTVKAVFSDGSVIEDNAVWTGC